MFDRYSCEIRHAVDSECRINHLNGESTRHRWFSSLTYIIEKPVCETTHIACHDDSRSYNNTRRTGRICNGNSAHFAYYRSPRAADLFINVGNGPHWKHAAILVIKSQRKQRAATLTDARQYFEICVMCFILYSTVLAK